MGRVLATLTALAVALAASFAHAQALQTVKAELEGTPEALAAALPRDLIQSRTDGGTVFIGYAGLEAPGRLADFATVVFGEPASAFLKAGQPANVSIALIPSRTGTMAQLMRHGPARDGTGIYEAVFGTTLPTDAIVLLSERTSAPCGGQLVLDRPIAAETATGLYAQKLRASGFLVGETTDADGTLILANGTPCAAMVFIQPDRTAPGRSTIVVRYLED